MEIGNERPGLKAKRRGLKSPPSAVLCWACILCMAMPGGAARRDKRRRADDREKYIPVETYRDLTVFERAAYDKALKLHRDGEYRAAAEMFRKFALQYEDSGAMPYAMLMEARCLHKRSSFVWRRTPLGSTMRSEDILSISSDNGREMSIFYAISHCLGDYLQKSRYPTPEDRNDGALQNHLLSLSLASIHRRRDRHDDRWLIHRQ